MVALFVVSNDFLWVWALCKEHGSCVISGSCHGVNEICIVIGFYPV